MIQKSEDSMINYNTGTLVIDRNLNIVDATEGYLGYVPEGRDNHFIENIKEEDWHLVHEMVERLADQERADICFRLCDKNGEYNWVTALCERVPVDNDSFNIRISFQDISIIGSGQKTLAVDFGTGLLSKQAITDYAKEMCKNPNNRIDLCILDIDNFKQINDSKGHSFGDKVLREVSEIISGVIGDNGKAGRIGGDELMLVIESAEDKNKLRNYLKPIRESVENLYRDKDGFPVVTVSVGSANYPLYVDNYEALFNLADRMLYRAKNRGKNRYVMYNPDIHGKIIDGVLLEENKVVQDTPPQDKMKMMLGAMEGLFGDEQKTVEGILMDMLATYELDEGYIFINDLKKSYFGYRRTENTPLLGENSMGRIVESSLDIKYVTEPEFDKLFNSNGVLVIDSPEKMLSNTVAAKEVFSTKGIKHAFFYKLKNKGSEGYFVLYNTRDLSRKFPQSDITDFTYLGKMIEIALKTR